MDAPCTVLGRRASDSECSSTVLAATADQMAQCRECERGRLLMASVRRGPFGLPASGGAAGPTSTVRGIVATDETSTPAAQPATQTDQIPAQKARKEAPMATYGTCKACGTKNRALPCRSLCSSCYAAFRERRKKWVALGNTGDPAPDFTGEEAASNAAPDVTPETAPIPPLGQQEGQGTEDDGDQLPGSECTDGEPRPDLDALSRVLGVSAGTLAEEMRMATYGAPEAQEASEGSAAVSLAGDFDPTLGGRLVRKPDENAENKAMSDALTASANGGPSVYHLTGERFDRAVEAAAFASTKRAIAEEAAVAATIPPADVPNTTDTADIPAADPLAIPTLETALSSITGKVAARMAEQDQPAQAPASDGVTGGVMIGGRRFVPLLASGHARKPSLTVYRKRCRLNIAALRALGVEDLEQGYVALYWSEEQAQLALRILPAQADGSLHLRFAKPRNKGAEFSTPVIARKFPLLGDENARFDLALQDGFLLAGAPVAGVGDKVEG